MGGTGSGCGAGCDAKETVENCLTLSASDFLQWGFRPGSAVLTWTGRRGATAAIRATIGPWVHSPAVTLSYRLPGGEVVALVVSLVSRRPHFGGLRWDFVCPLAYEGHACGRRAYKLYRPPAKRSFGCRHCHRLTYHSARTAHAAERMAGKMGMSVEAAAAFLVTSSLRWCGGPNFENIEGPSRRA